MLDTSDYVSFVLSFPKVPPLSVLTMFFLGIVRMAPIVALAPFLGARLPNPVKMGIAISLTAIMLPHIMMTAHLPAPTFDFNFILLGVKEAMIGMIITFLVGLPFYIAQSSGVLIDFLRGSSALQVTDPFSQAQASSIGLLYNYVFVVLFYEINGPFYFLEGLMKSYTIIPVDSFINSAFFQLKHPFWQAVMLLLTQFTALSIQLAAPSLVAILMAEMFLGIANRLAPQVQIAFLGMSIKSLLGIALLWAGWYFILQQIGKQSLLYLKMMDQLLMSIPK
jgi:type III secretion protein T